MNKVNEFLKSNDYCNLFIPPWVKKDIILNHLKKNGLEFSSPKNINFINMSNDIDKNMQLINILIEHKIVFKVGNSAKLVNNYKTIAVQYKGDEIIYIDDIYHSLYGVDERIDNIGKINFKTLKTVIDI